MCDNPDKKYLEDLLNDYKETVHLLSNKKKREREIMVCRAFLRCAGIPFIEEQITAPEDDPPDIRFDTARFEVRLLLDEGRKMHREWKEKVQRVEEAKNIDDVMLSRPSLKPITLAEVVPLIIGALKDKFERYSKRGISCGTLDALVYVNRRETYLVPTSSGVYNEELDTKKLDIQGWRSVSVLMSASGEIIDNQAWLSPARPVTASQLKSLGLDSQPLAPLYSLVLTATPTAPNFFRERAGRILNECPDQEGLFEP